MGQKKKKVIVMGKGDLGIRIAAWFKNSENYRLVSIVPVIPEPLWTGSISGWAKANKIPLIKSGDFKDVKNLREIDLVFSVFYDKIIPPESINKFVSSASAAPIKQRRRILNIHNGPLPKYRGVSPINWALKNREKEHGITIHEITSSIDAGPIVSQLKYSIYPEFDEVKDVYDRALSYGFLLFEQTMPILEKIKPRPQRESEATYYSQKQHKELRERKNFTKTESK